MQEAGLHGILKMSIALPEPPFPNPRSGWWVQQGRCVLETPKEDGLGTPAMPSWAARGCLHLGTLRSTVPRCEIIQTSFYKTRCVVQVSVPTWGCLHLLTGVALPGTATEDRWTVPSSQGALWSRPHPQEQPGPWILRPVRCWVRPPTSSAFKSTFPPQRKLDFKNSKLDPGVN